MNSVEQLELLIERAKETGVLTERLRIIKLLEEIKVITADQKFFVIQAIKGEQK